MSPKDLYYDAWISRRGDSAAAFAATLPPFPDVTCS